MAMASQDRIELTAEMKRRCKPDYLIQAHQSKSSKMSFSAYDLGGRQNENTPQEKWLIVWDSRLNHRTESDGPFFHPKSLILGVDDDDDNDGDEDEDDEDKQEDDGGDGALFEDVHIDGNSAGPTRRQRKKVQKKRRQSRRQRTKTCFFKPPPQQTKEKNLQDKSKKKKKRPALDYSEWSADESYFPPFASDDYDDDYALNYGVADAIATNSSLGDDEESRQEAEDSSSFHSRNDDSIGTFGPIIHGEDRSGDSARVTIDGETDNETTMSSHHSVESGVTHNDTVQPRVTTEKTEMMHSAVLRGVGNVLQSLPQHSSSPRHDTETTGDTDDDEKTITYSNDDDDDERNDNNNNNEGMICNISEREESSWTQRYVNNESHVNESNKPVATGKRSRSDSLWPPRRRRRVFTEKGSGRTSVDESPFQSKISERDCHRKPINLMSDSEREDNDDDEEETQQDQQSDQEEPKDDNEPADTRSGNVLIDLTNDDEDDDDDDDDDEVQIIEPDTNKTVELSTPIVEPSPTAAAARSAARRQYIEYSQPKVPVARAQQHHGDTDDDDDDYEGEIHYRPKGRKMSHNIILDSDDEDDDRKPAAVLVEPSADDFDSTNPESDNNDGVLDEAEAERQRYFAEKRRREVNETFEMITVPPEYHRRHVLLLRPAAEKTTTMNDDDTVNSDNLMMNNDEDDDDDDYDDNETMKKMRKTVKKQKTTKKKGKQAKYGGNGTQCHNRRRINRKPFVKPMHPWRRRPHVPRREAHRFTLTDFNKVMSIAAPK